jgi:hypothetical protein
VLRIVIARKHPSPWPGSNPQLLGGKHTNYYTTEAALKSMGAVYTLFYILILFFCLNLYLVGELFNLGLPIKFHIQLARNLCNSL